jgi:hypothetical protein
MLIQNNLVKREIGRGEGVRVISSRDSMFDFYSE